MDPKVKKKVRDRLARIEGQVRGVSRMVDEDSYCIDVLTQLNSVSAAIDGLGVVLLEDHVRTCLADAAKTGNAETKIGELAEAVRRFVRV